MANNQNSEIATSRVSAIVSDTLVAICRVILRTLLWVAKHFWKRYFDIETPVYKLWWKAHAVSMQKKLDKDHQRF